MRRLFVAIFFLSTALLAADSQNFAFRADKALQAGKFAKANGLYERALLSSRKESDIVSEGRILISMAMLRVQSLDLNMAKDLLKLVRKSDLDTNTLGAYYLAWMELYLEEENYDKVIDIKYSLSEKFLKEIPGGLRGGILNVAAMAFAGKGDAQNARLYLKDADDALDGEAPGKMAFASARVAHLLQDDAADSLYDVALKSAVRSHRPFMSATILYYRGLNEKRPDIARDYFVRSANAFELMGLRRNSERAKAGR